MKKWQDMYPDVAKGYPEITVELWIHGSKQDEPFWAEVRGRFNISMPQRLAVGWPELGTQFEFILVPLDNDWESLRMTGTDGRFTCVGVVGHGCYAFDLNTFTEAGYISEKLGMGMPEAIGTMLLFQKLSGKEDIA